MSDFAGLNTALTGLLAHRRAMDVIGNNITNVNTDGYHRQRVELQASGGTIVPAIFSRGRAGGDGVDVSALLRVRDQFLESRSLAEHGSLSSLQKQSTAQQRIEAIFNEPSDTGMASQLDDFWAAWSDLSNTPDSSAARAQLLERGRTIASTINRSAADLTALHTSTVDNLNALTDEVNTLAHKVADLNATIRTSIAGGLTPNSLMDDRDLAIRRLAELTGATVRDGQYGMVDVSIGSMTIVRDDKAQDLEVYTATVPGSAAANVGLPSTGLRWKSDHAPVIPVAGELHGYLQTVNNSIPSSLSQLNDIATKLVTEVNDLHETGYGLDDTLGTGGAGRDFFSPIGTAPPYPAAALAVDPALDARGIAASDGTGRLDASISKKIGDLQTSTTGSSAAYRAMIAQLGVDSANVQSRAQIQQSITQQVDGERDAVGGVNLDEEMISLTQSQRAYEASARLMTVIDSMIDTLINRVGA